MRRFVFVVGIYACGTASVAPPSGTYASGTRLRANVLDAGGGALLFQSWHDAQLGFDCVFSTVSDGSIRCVPPSDGDVGYLDSACTQLAIALSSPSSATYASVAAPTPACSFQPDPTSPVTVYTLGAVQPSSTLLYNKDSGTCVPNATHGTTYAVTVAPSETFVGAHVNRESRGAVDSEIVVGDDGSIQLWGIRDHARDARCVTPDSIYAMGEGPPTPRCISPYVAWDGFYDSTSCAGAREAYIGSGCAAPALALSALQVTCGQPVPLFSLGSIDPAATPYYLGSDGTTCQPFTYTAGLDFYPELAPADLSSYPALGEARIGTGRVALPVLTAPGDSRVLGVETLRRTLGAALFFDTARNKPCGATTFKDGTVRCVTAGTAQINIDYADAACTQRLAQVPIGCEAPIEAVDGVFSNVYPITGAYTGTVYEMQTTCVPVTTTTVANYTIGNAIDPNASFPVLVARTE